MQLAYQDYGHRGEPLIILHGLFGSRENWHSISVRLSEHFRVFALDQRNHGESSRHSTMDYRNMAEDVHEFMVARHLEPAHVLGHSMGGKTAMQLALLHPEAVQSLTSVDMAPRAYSPRHRKALEGLLALDLASFQTRKQMEDALEPWVPELAVRRFLLKNVQRDPGGSFQWGIGLQEILQNYSRLSEALESDRPYSGPALFVRGAQSDYLVEDDLECIRRLFPKAQLATVPEAGHLLHVENPKIFLALLLEFLRANRR